MHPPMQLAPPKFKGGAFLSKLAFFAKNRTSPNGLVLFLRAYKRRKSEPKVGKNAMWLFPGDDGARRVVAKHNKRTNMPASAMFNPLAEKSLEHRFQSLDAFYSIYYNYGNVYNCRFMLIVISKRWEFGRRLE